jgi:hypothetical protein
MTGYTVHTGASKKFVSGWDKVFGNAPSEKAAGKSPQSPRERPGVLKQKKARRSSTSRLIRGRGDRCYLSGSY